MLTFEGIVCIRGTPFSVFLNGSQHVVYTLDASSDLLDLIVNVIDVDSGSKKAVERGYSQIGVVDDGRNLLTLAGDSSCEEKTKQGLSRT